jgi:hypothetical protein
MLCLDRSSATIAIWLQRPSQPASDQRSPNHQCPLGMCRSRSSRQPCTFLWHPHPFLPKETFYK